LLQDHKNVSLSGIQIMENFKQRWHIKSNWQLIIIFIVFAITGTTSSILSKPILAFFGITKDVISGWLYYPLYIVLIFPVYQILLVFFGFIFGQFTFFWAFEKKFLRSLRLGFIVDWFEKK
jgi:manganese efflux pump family protein